MPNPENLRDQAKLVLRWHRDRYYPVAAQIGAVLPRYRGLNGREILAARFGLSDAQELVARQHGFASWQALKAVPRRHGTFYRMRLFHTQDLLTQGRNDERFNLPHRFGGGHSIHSVVLRPPLNLVLSQRTSLVAITEHPEAVPVQTPTSFLQWTPVIAGALVASAFSLVLIAFGSAIGLSIVSSSPTWRDASPALALLSGLFLLLVAIASFGLGGYVAGRLRERWHLSVHDDLVEFRDGTHGVVAWALAVVITGLVAAVSVTAIASRAVQPATSPAATTGEPLIAYELDRLFRTDRSLGGDVTYIRAEAGRILLAATGRSGITADDRSYLVRLVATRTGIAPPDADRRVNDAITAATTAVHTARRSAVILAFASAVSLLVGAAVAWFASCVGGRQRDNAAPSPTWRLPQRA